MIFVQKYNYSFCYFSIKPKENLTQKFHFYYIAPFLNSKSKTKKYAC